jgi:general secretion pathway protein A
MYENFYGLRECPFDLTPNPRYLYLTPRHREALSNLQYGIAGRKGITLLVGEAGTGKTTLVRAAIDAVASQTVQCVYLSNPILTRDEFYEYLAPRLGLTGNAGDSKARFLSELEESLLAHNKAGRTIALVVDEAQSMPHELMEEVRLLANFETAEDKLLQVVLAGQPELADRLEDERLRQLKQRVALRCDLLPLDVRETAAYISGRIAIAGGQATRIFTREAIQTIHQYSGGIPRTISVICDNAMVTAFASATTPIGAAVVLDVCRDFRLTGSGRSSAGGATDVPHSQEEAEGQRPSAKLGDSVNRAGRPEDAQDTEPAHARVVSLPQVGSGAGGDKKRPESLQRVTHAPPASGASRATGTEQRKAGSELPLSAFSRKRRFRFF